MSQQKGDPNELEMMSILIAVVGGGFLFLIWFFFKNELIHVFKWIRYSEMWLVSQVVDANYTLTIPEIGKQSFAVWFDWLPQSYVQDIRFAEIKAITYIALEPLKFVFVPLLGIMAILVNVFSSEKKYKRKMNLQKLMEEQAKSFPIIAPFIKFNPCKLEHRTMGAAVPSKLPLFAEALSPEEWVTYNRVEFKNKKLDHEKTFRALALQLGGRWQGPLKLPIHAQCLYAVFALKHARKRKESEALLDELSLAWSAKGGFKPSGKTIAKAKKAIRDPKIGGKLREYADKHAFTTTALLRCLARAREEGGVLAPATFLWLRGVDRKLWYPLNNLGRKAYHAEASGAMIHYVNELIAGQKIPSPKFDDAIKGLEDFLKGPAAKPIPPLKEVGGKK